MNRFRRLALLCLGAPLLLQACASVAPSRSFDVDNDAASRQYTGRFSANYVRYGRDEGVQGSFRWEEQGRNVRLDLVSPLGQTLAVVTATPSGATLDLPNQPPRNAPEVDTLMEEALGFALPVAGMRDWLHGRPTQGAPARATRDLAWQEPSATGAGAAQVPRRIDLARDAGNNPLSVRLVIDPQTP
jgi:outer membrane lipoprotein LolB